MSLVMGLWVAHAAPLAVCTDRGPLVGEVTSDGAVEATLGGVHPVSGTREALVIEAHGDVVYRGSLEALHPRASALHPDRRALAEALAAQLGMEVVVEDDTVSVGGEGFSGRVGPDGLLRGTRADRTEVWALDADGRAFGGPAPLRAPLIDVALRHGLGRPAVTVRVGADHLRAVGHLLDCGRGGPAHVGVGIWRDPIPLPDGTTVTDGRVHEALLRDADDAPTWLLALPADRALAGELQAGLQATWPELQPEVRWADGAALVSLSRSASWALPGDPVEPVEGGPRLAPLLDPHPAVLWGTRLSGEQGFAALEAGRELVAMLSHHRAAMGLAPLRWDAPLAMGAVMHGAWLQRDAAPDGHRQESGEPLFVGERPQDRGGAHEVVYRRHGAASWEALQAWLQAPLHRVYPLHPGAVSAGAVVLPRAAVAEVRIPEREAVPAVVFPPDDSEAPGVRFSGRESPDPLPLHRYPDRVWPVGLPVTLWGARGTRLRAVALRVDGDRTDAWAVEPGPSAPREAVHLIPREPLPPGAEVRWRMSVEGPEGPRVHTGRFRTPEDALADEVPLTGEPARAVAEANARRAEAGHRPLRATERARALARLSGARTRAVAQGLPVERVRRRLAPVRGVRLDGAQRICLRPGDRFEVDDSWVDDRITTIGVEEGATTLSWVTDPDSGEVRISLAGPRTCVLLLSQ